MALCLAIPNMTIFAPSSAEEIPGMLADALSLEGPAALRFPKTLPKPFDGKTGIGLHAREVTRGDGSLCVLAVGKMAPAAYEALSLLGEESSRVTLYDVRVLPPDPEMIDDAVRHQRIITIEDGTRHGGAGTLMVSAVRERAQDLEIERSHHTHSGRATRVSRSQQARRTARRDRARCRVDSPRRCRDC